MSEFSESFHLRTFNPVTVERFLKNANLTGYIFPESNGWVTFVADINPSEVEEDLISVNPSILIHYIYQQDHMWQLKIYKKDELIFDYLADWGGTDLEIVKKLFDLDFLLELIEDPAIDLNYLEAVFNFKSKQINLENTPAYLIAKVIGLTYFENISFNNVEAFDESDYKEYGIMVIEQESDEEAVDIIDKYVYRHRKYKADN